MFGVDSVPQQQAAEGKAAAGLPQSKRLSPIIGQHWTEFADDGGQVALGSHDGLNFFVGGRGFVAELFAAVVVEPDVVHLSQELVLSDLLAGN